MQARRMKPTAPTWQRTPAPPGLGAVLEFMRELWAMEHALQRASKRMESTLGVTGPQRLVIRVIGKFPGISAGDLSEVLCTHPSTLTGILKRLEASHAIRRDAHPLDGRRALLYLTPAGVQLDRMQEGTVEASVRRVLGGLPAARVNIVSAVLRQLSEGLSSSPVSAVARRRR